MVVVFLSWVPSAWSSVPDWLRVSARISLPQYSDDTNAVVLLDEQITTVSNNSEIKTLYRRAYRILRPKGREHATILVHFDSETQLSSLKAWSVPVQGPEYEVKEKDAIETGLSAESLYQDTRYKVLRIPAADPGSIVGYEYEQRRRASILQDEWRFQRDIPVLRARLILRLPQGWEFEAFWLNHAFQEAKPVGQNQWLWELESVPAIEREPLMPAGRSVAGRLAVTYFQSGKELSGKSHTSWNDVARWFTGLAAGRRQSTPEIHQKAIDLTSQAGTLLDKIRALATFVQREIRYVSIAIGIGAYQPHQAQEILVNRYGDCKDKATLLSTMLNAIGIESYYVLIHSERGVVARNFPSMLNFNHVILAIRLPDDSLRPYLYSTLNHPRLGRLLLFDPTDPLTPFGYLPPTLQENCGLLVREDGGELVDLPILAPSLNRLTRGAKLELTSGGTLKGYVTEVRLGEPAATSRAKLLAASQSDRRKVLENFLGEFLGGFLLLASGAENLDDLDKNLVLHYGFVAENYAKVAGNLMLFRPCVLGRKGNDVFEKKERKYPIEFVTASVDTDTFEIALPDGYEVEELPQAVETSFGFSNYKSQFEVKGNILRYRRIFTVNGTRLAPERLDELKEFYRQIADDERSSVVLKRAIP